MEFTSGIAGTIAETRKSFEGVFQIISEVDSESVRKGASTFLNSLFLFGECELVIKRAERLEILFPATKLLKPELISDALKINEYGIQVLQKSIADFSEKKAINKGERAPNDYDFTKEIRKGIDGWTASLKNYLLECPVKPKDVSEIWEVMQEISKINNTGKLKEYIISNLKKLQEYRLSETRGTDKNIAWWKIAAIAVILGIAIWGVCCCLQRWCGCSEVAMAAANIGLGIAVLVWWYC